MILLCGPAAAAEKQSDHDDEVLVTASHEPMDRNIVAATVTVITREEIDRMQVKYVGDLLRSVPGFAVSQSGGLGAQTQIRVRGAESNQLLVLMDGMRVNDPASNDEFQYQYQLASNIERIEIIRGPQSAIWGTDALAGVINIIRRKEVRQRYVNARAEYGSFDTVNFGVDGGVALGRSQLSGGIAYLDSDGTNISREGDEKDGTETTVANAVLDVQATDALKLSFSGQVEDAESEFDDVDFFVTGLPTDTDRVTEADRVYLRAEAKFNPQPSRWNGAFAINWLDTDNENIYDGEWESSTAAESLELKAHTSVQLDSEARHRLTLALDWEDLDFQQRGIASPFGDPNQDQGYDIMGYATEYAAEWFDGFHITASARLDDFSDFEDAVTWQLAASQQLPNDFTLRGSVGTGSKAPTFIERFGFIPGQFIGNPDLKPEESSGWEIGIDKSLASDLWRIGVTYYDQELKDEINGFVFDLDTFLFTAENREGKSLRNGVEVVLSGEITSDLSVNASYTYLDATEGDAEGNHTREVRRPRNMATLSANYLFLNDRGLVNLNVNYNGSQLDSYFPPPFFAEERVLLDSFLTLDMAGSWQLTDTLELVARVTNLTDEDYEEVLGYARPGRGVYAGIRGRFRP